MYCIDPASDMHALPAARSLLPCQRQQEWAVVDVRTLQSITGSSHLLDSASTILSVANAALFLLAPVTYFSKAFLRKLFDHKVVPPPSLSYIPYSS